MDMGDSFWWPTYGLPVLSDKQGNSVPLRASTRVPGMDSVGLHAMPVVQGGASSPGDPTSVEGVGGNGGFPAASASPLPAPV
jgi:hypothetical protein